MCGLVAILSKQKSVGFVYKDKSIFQQMLVADVFRGMDSTGVFGVNSYGNVKMAKEASASPYFLCRKDVKDMVDDMYTKYHIMVGHNRKATQGAVSDLNAHPFIEDHIILVHNGTLTNHRELANTTVDSHAICKSIATDGYKHMLQNIEGAYALIWYNTKEKTLYFTRNAERPLSLVETSDRVYLASEAKMLDWILDRNDIKKYEIQNVPTGNVFKFSMDTRKLEVESSPKKEKPSQNKKFNHTAALLTDQRNSVEGSNYKNRQLALVSSNSASGRSLREWADSYTIGDEVPFTVQDFEIYNHGAKLIGTADDGSGADVSCWIDENLSMHELDNYVNAEVLIGKVSSVAVRQSTGLLRIHMKKPVISHYIKSKNDIMLTRHLFDQHGGCCWQCGTVIDDELIKNSNIIKTNGKIQNIMCPQCVQNKIDEYYANQYNGGSLC